MVARKLRSRLTLRVALLMLVLSGVSLYASSVATRHKLRTRWRQTLNVGVVLLGPGGVGLEKKELIARGLPRLDALFTHEFLRYRPDGHLLPVHFVLAGAAGVDDRPPLPPDDPTYFERVKHAFELWRYLHRVDNAGGVVERDYDARLYVMLEPAAPTATRFVEGIGAKDGDVGVILAQVDASSLNLMLMALGHEFLHFVGATDKYDAIGRAESPEDLAEPDRRPLFPQRYAEIMVGEIGLSPSAGRVPDHLDQIAIGPKTAREIGWVRDQAPAPAPVTASAAIP